MSSRRWTVAIAVILALVIAFVIFTASAHAFERYLSARPAAAAQDE